MKRERLLRTEIILGSEAVRRLENSFVVVVGVGAVGGYCLEALARMGVGKFRLVDFDTFEVTNLNRQILAVQEALGRKKVFVAQKRLHSIDSGIAVETMPVFCGEDNIDAVLEGNPDLVVDAIDSVDAKCLLLKTCYERGIPAVSSMGAALHLNPAFVRTGDIMDTSVCPLAKQVRVRLKKVGAGRGIQAVYSVEKAVSPAEDISVLRQDKFLTDTVEGRKKQVLGSLPTITGIFGLTLAHLAMNTLIMQNENNVLK